MVNIRSSVKFELLVLPPLFIEINSFVCTNRKDLASKAKFKQANNPCKMVLEAANFLCANETKKSITSLKLAYRDVWQNANNILNKDKCVIHLLFNGPKVVLCI